MCRQPLSTSFGEPQGAVDVLREDARREAELGVVRQADRFVDVGERRERDGGAEEFFAADPHRRFHVVENRRPQHGPLAFAADDQRAPPAATASRIQPSTRSASFCADERAELRGVLQLVAGFQRGDFRLQGVEEVAADRAAR